MYNAFISYSHAADGKLAPALQNALEKFAKPWYKIRNLNIFRDEGSLSASPHLWSNIETALGKSEYLIYMASRSSENSKWVNKEIEHWVTHKSLDTLLIVLTEGELTWDDTNNCFVNPENNCLPPALDDKFSAEPFYIDLREIKTQEDYSLNNSIFKKEILKLAAQLHGKEPKDIASDEVTEHRKMIRIRNFAVGALVLLLIAALTAGWLANSQRKQLQISLDELRSSNNKILENLLSRSNEYIYHLEYEKAFDLTADALQLDKKSAKVKQSFMEILFFYSESNAPDSNKLNAIKWMEIASGNKFNKAFTNKGINQWLGEIDHSLLKLLTEKYYPVMIKITGGDFMMGCNKKECEEDEKPEHLMHVNDFQISQSEITFWQYNLYCKSMKRDLRKQQLHYFYDGDNPIGYVNWYDAVSYCNWLSTQLHISASYKVDSSKTDSENRNHDNTESMNSFDVKLIPAGNGFRLPTESEWEYAAGEQGEKKYKYSGSNDALRVGWFIEAYDKLSQKRSQPVMKKQPNKCGIYDMSGNVSEWCWNWFEDYQHGQANDFYGKSRIQRGGAWDDEIDSESITKRQMENPLIRRENYGFRVARSSKNKLP